MRKADTRPIAPSLISAHLPANLPAEAFGVHLADCRSLAGRGRIACLLLAKPKFLVEFETYDFTYGRIPFRADQ